MTVEINSGSEVFLAQLVQDGVYETPQHAIDAALKLLREQQEAQPSPIADVPKMSIVELFANSPFRGLDIEFPRDRSPMRDIDL